MGRVHDRLFADEGHRERFLQDKIEDMPFVALGLGDGFSPDPQHPKHLERRLGHAWRDILENGSGWQKCDSRAPRSVWIGCDQRPIACEQFRALACLIGDLGEMTRRNTEGASVAVQAGIFDVSSHMCRGVTGMCISHKRPLCKTFFLFRPLSRTLPAKRMPSEVRKVSQPHLSIAQRLRAARQRQGVTQTVLAEAMGISRDQLASVESYRVPLRFWPSLRACDFLKLSLRWLATGAGDASRRCVINITRSEQSVVLEQSSLAEGFAQVAMDYSEMEMLLCPIPFEETLTPETGQMSVKVDSSQSPGDAVTVPSNEISLWGRLRQRLLIAVFNQGHGAQSAIAENIGVSRQAVSDWLSGKSSPGAEMTLRLLNWVRAIEAQKEETLPALERGQGRRTRQRQIHYK